MSHGTPSFIDVSNLSSPQETRLAILLPNGRLPNREDHRFSNASVPRTFSTEELAGDDLFDEQVAGPARERLYRGEIERFPDEVREAFSKLLHLQLG